MTARPTSVESPAPHIDILGLEAFLAIAREGRFHRAARALHITQTALTRRLQNFEEQLGVRLVERTTRSVALTELGESFLPQARRLVSELGAALVEIRETGRAKRGDVTIACVPTVGVQYLPRVIRAYAARYPQNRIRILDHSSWGVTEAVLRREVELGITLARQTSPELRATELLEDRFVLVCRDDHPLAELRAVAWRTARSHPLVFVGAESGNRPLLDRALEGLGPPLEARYEVQRSSTAVGLAAAGVAAAVVPSLAVQPDTYPRLRVLPLVRPTVSRSLVLVELEAAELSPAARALHDLILAGR